jgi:hypothetical protein
VNQEDHDDDISEHELILMGPDFPVLCNIEGQAALTALPEQPAQAHPEVRCRN